MEKIGKDEPQEEITGTCEIEQILRNNKELTDDQILSELKRIQEDLGLSSDALKTFQEELKDTEQEYSRRQSKNQPKKVQEALEKIQNLQRGIELIILTNQRGIKYVDPKIKQLTEQMEKIIDELGLTNYEDVKEEISILQQNLSKPMQNAVKKKKFESELRKCLEVQAIYEEIQTISHNQNKSQLEEEYNQLLEQLGTTLEEIPTEIQECKENIQRFAGKKKETEARETLANYERLNELAQILKKSEESNVPKQQNEQVIERVQNPSVKLESVQEEAKEKDELQDAKQQDEQKEAALKEYKQQKLIQAVIANYERTKDNVQSFEKCLNECLYHLGNKIQSKKYTKEISNEELIKLIQDLQLREQIEELNVSQEINEVLSYMRTTQNYDKIFDTLKVLSFNTSIVAFNFLEFISLMKLVEDTSNIIKDKDIILFLGVTGSGKSTTIQYLCGSTMKAMQIKGLNHIEAVDVKSNQLKNIKSSPFAKSETRYVTPITINLLDLGYIIDQEAILVDSPGSGDLESVEVDLANTLGIFKSVRQAKSVRLVLLFGYQNLGNRFEHLKDQLKFYSSIIDDLKDNCKAITYAFTQIPVGQTDQIQAKLRNIYAELNKEDQSNADLKIFLADATAKAIQNKIIIIDPLDQKPLKVLLDILSSHQIDYPRTAFKFTMSSKVKAALEQEFTFSHKMIGRAISNNEYHLAIEKLQTLKHVSQILAEDKNTQTFYKDLVSHTKRLFQLYGKKVEEFIKRHQIVENVIQENEIKEVIDNLQKLNDMQPLKKGFFDDDGLKGASNYQFAIIELAQKMVTDLKDKEIEQKDWDTTIAKLEVLSKHFDKCLEIDKQSYEYFQEKLQQHQDQFDHYARLEIEKPVIENNKYSFENKSESQSAQLFSRIIRAKQTLQNPKCLQLLDQALEQTENLIKQKFETEYNEKIKFYIIKDDKNINFDEKAAFEINSFLDLLQNFYKNYNQLSKNLKNFCDYQQSSLKEEIIELFEKSFKEFKDLLHEKNHPKLKQAYNTIVCIRKIKPVENDTQVKFQQLSFDIQIEMKDYTEKIEQVLHKLSTSDKKEVESQLRILKKSLRKVQQLSVILCNDYLLDQFKEEVHQELSDWKESLMKDIPPMISGFFELDQLEDIFKTYNLLLRIEKCYSILQIQNSNLSNDLKIMLDENFQSTNSSITQIGKNISQLQIRKSDLDMLYRCSITIKIAENHSFKSFNSQDAQIIKLSELSSEIQNLVKQYTKIITQKFQEHFELLKKSSADVQVKNENDLILESDKYDYMVRLIIQIVKIIIDAENNKKDFFKIMTDENELLMILWQKELSTLSKQVQNMLALQQNKQNKKLQQIYLSFAESLCNFDPFLPEQQQIMKKTYENYRKIFSQNQPQFQQNIQKELEKDPTDCRYINEQLKNIKEHDFNTSDLLFEIENLLIMHVRKLKERVSFKEEGHLFELTNSEVIGILKEMVEQIDPNDELIQNFRKQIKETLTELEKQVIYYFTKNMDQLNYYIESHHFVLVDKSLKTNKTYLTAFYQLNKDKHQEFQTQLKEYKKKVHGIIQGVIDSIDDKKNGLLMIKKQSEFFIKDELKNRKLQQMFDQIKSKVTTRIKEKIEEFEGQEQQDDLILEGSRVIEQVLNNLPQSYTSNLIQHKQTLDEKLQKMQIEESNQIDKLQKNNNVQELIKKYIASKDKKTKLQHEEYFQKFAYEQIRSAETSLRDLNIVNTFEFLANIYELIKILEKNILQHISSQFNSVIQRLADKVQDFASSIYQYVNMNLEEEKMKQNMMQIQSFYRELIKKQNLHQNPILKETKTIVDSLFESLNQEIIKMQNSFNQNKPNQQSFSFEKYISEYQKYHKIFLVLKACKDKAFLQFIGYQPLINLENDDFGFPEVEQEVKNLIESMLDSIKSIQLIQEGIEFEIIANHQNIDKINRNLDYLCKVKNFFIGDITQETIQQYKKLFENQTFDQFDQFHNKIQEVLPKILSSDDKMQNMFSNYLQNLESMGNNIKSFNQLSKKIKTFSNGIQQKILQDIEIWKTSIIQLVQTDHQQAAFILIDIQRFTENIMFYQNQILDSIQEIFLKLQKLQREQFSKIVLGLYQCLEVNPHGMNIINRNPIFQSEKRSLFNKRFQSFGIDYVLENLTDNSNQDTERDKIDRDNLRKCYEEYKSAYGQRISQYLPKKDFKSLIKEIKMKSASCVKNVTEAIPELVALIFALWSLINATTLFNPDPTNKSDKDYLLQPQAAQVISIFRILGIGYEKPWKLFGKTLFTTNDNSIKNNLVEIKTGEGKSITLGVVSIIFSLLGYKVNCVCYSKYLSQRDYSTFISLFQHLDVTDKIFYGTFNEICEKIINKDGDIRELILKKVLKDYKPQKAESDEINPKEIEVLLIDEVDVFFTKSFYGELYQPKVSVSHAKIKELILYIWENKQKKKELKLEEIQNQPIYKECYTIFNPDYAFLLDEALKNMLYDLCELKNHKEYECIQGQLGYKEQDQINFKISIRYLTMWANCKEFDEKKVSEENRDTQLCLGLKCGAFSYAEIAQKFQIILGVSGTLKTLTDVEKTILKKYKVSQLTYVPSVYGKSNLSYYPMDDIFITNKVDQQLVIIKNINDNISGKKNNKYDRAVIIIFEDEKKLQEFYKSDLFADLKNSNTRTVIRLTEKCTEDEKIKYIRQATQSGSITLATKTFGRGTDFISLDKQLNDNGGIHVIQTFFATSLSEEVQIMGRTARQGSNGSYCMILLDSELSQFGISGEVIAQLKQMKGVYPIINEKRNETQKQFQQIETDGIEKKISKPHQEAEQFRLNLLANQKQFIIDTLKRFNKGKESAKTIRTLILMDATGSMGSLILNTKKEISDICQRVSDIIKQTGSSLIFQIQIAAYRNYNAPPGLILECSSWETNHENLRNFLSTITAQYGMGPEAIEVGLWHAGQQVDILSQVLLIGDAPPNSSSVIREHINKNPYNISKYSKVNHYEKELEKLIEKNVPVYAYYVDKYAQPEFDKIATATKGKCSYLDLNSKEGSDYLRDSIAKQLLSCAGKSLGVKDLEELYDKCYNS